ncbi:MAG: CHAT domain-containing protein [Bacteroidota bacterium]
MTVNHVRKADSLNNLGIELGKKGALEEAATHFIRAAQLLGNDSLHNSLKGDIHNNLGLVNKLQGKYKEALKQYLTAANLYGKTSSNLAGTYNNIGNLYVLTGEYSRAEEYLLKAYNLLRNKRDNSRNLSTQQQIANNLGILYKNIKKPERAQEMYLKSLGVLGNSDQYKDIGTHMNLANSFAAQGKYDEAIAIYENILNMAHVKHPSNAKNLAQTLQNYALIQTEQQHYTKSLQKLKEALKITINVYGEKHTLSSKILANIGILYQLKGNPRTSLQYYQKALFALSPEPFNRNYKQNPDEEKIKSKKQLLKVLKDKSNSLQALGLATDSLPYLETALEIHHLRTNIIKNLRTGYLDQQSKLFLLASEKSTFDEAIYLSHLLYEKTRDPHYLNAAFYFSEASKAAILYENLQTNRAMDFAGIPEHLMQREHMLKKDTWMYQELIYEETKRDNPGEQKLAYWNTRLFETKQHYEALIDTFETFYPDYYKLKYDQSILALGEVQQRLSPHEVILEYHVQDSILFSFLIQKEHAHMEKTPIDSGFSARIHLIDSLLKKNNFSTHVEADFAQMTSSLHSLYTTLIKPHHATFKAEDVLVIIPDGELAYLPFEVLLTEPADVESLHYKKLAYLLKDYPIQYSYSANLHLENSTFPQRADKKLAAFAPTYKAEQKFPDPQVSTRQQYREQLFPILGIIEEASAVSRLMKGETYLKSKATEKAFKQHAKEYDILHLAMHTLIDDQNPLYSKMAFTQLPDSLEDGFLNTFEIFNMNLSSRMAVLSSCNTGRGKLLHGEGVMSLARGFMYAGCPSIVMTLWAVEDKSGVSLMTYFYENLKSGMSKPQALQQAKLTFLNNADKLHAHPYFWSGYVSIGDIHPLYEKKNLPPWMVAGGIVATILLIFFAIRWQRCKRSGL